MLIFRSCEFVDVDDQVTSFLLTNVSYPTTTTTSTTSTTTTTTTSTTSTTTQDTTPSAIPKNGENKTSVQSTNKTTTTQKPKPLTTTSTSTTTTSTKIATSQTKTKVLDSKETNTIQTEIDSKHASSLPVSH